MDKHKDDLYYAKRLIKSIEIAIKYLQFKSIDDVLNDGFLQDALKNRFTKIAEDASKLSSSFKKTLSEIPWPAISSIRNRICHDYDVVDAPVLFNTVKRNFPYILDKILSQFKTYIVILSDNNFATLSSSSNKIFISDNIKNKYINSDEFIIFFNINSKERFICEVINKRTFSSMDEFLTYYQTSYSKFSKNSLINADLFSNKQVDGLIAIEVRVY